MSSLDKLGEFKKRKNALIKGTKDTKGPTPARKRIMSLFDEGSFIEIDSFVKHRGVDFDLANREAPYDGVITGYGTVDGRLVYAYSQDVSVLNGTIGEMHAKKIVKIMDMAAKMGAPVVGIIDSKGARLEEGLDALSGYGEIFYKNALLSGVVPQISLVLGTCPGVAALTPAMSDFTVMLKDGQLFYHSPEVIKANTNEDVEASGKANFELGNADFLADSEDEAIAKVKLLLSYLPSNNLSDAPMYECTDDLNRLNPELVEIADTDYDVRSIIASVVDDGAFFESQEGYAKNIVTGFARLNGVSVGVVANQPSVGNGALDRAACEKASRFIRICDSFNIGILTITNADGFVLSAKEEKSGAHKALAKLLYSYSEATIPKVTVIVKKAYGGAYLAMGAKQLGADLVLAWPTAEVSIINPDAAATILQGSKLAGAKDPIKDRKKLIENYIDNMASPYEAAKRGYIDDIIPPDETRQRVISAFEMLQSKRESKPAKKHANLPL